MDIVKALRELYNEKKQLDLVISSLEARLNAVRKGKPTRGRRGRKSMSAAERSEVSKRMTLYWETRRAQLRQSQESPAASSGGSSLNEENKTNTTSA
jgi:hypothetical protein